MNAFDVIIIGAGVSGIGMACALKAKCPGKTWVILERRHRLGGTWDLFNYPGVRSDSDMLTYGYEFRPWLSSKLLADGPSIRKYLVDTAHQYGVDSGIRYGLMVTRAVWSQSRQRWIVTAYTERTGETIFFCCSQLLMCTGYYDPNAGYSPGFPGIERYTGQVIHPQHWPKNFELSGKRVVVIGSGATAISMVPAIAKLSAHVTLLQRNSSYILSLPSTDALTEAASRVLPRQCVFAIARKRNVMIARWIYQASRNWPDTMRTLLLWRVRKHLSGSAEMVHFSPTYMPWDQRLCVVPDGDFFEAIKSGKASVITGNIKGFDGNKIILQSGEALNAECIVTATGLNLQVFGGIQVFINGRPYAPQRHMLYKGVLMENLPNCAWIVGYTNLSWTLKVDIAAAYICRLINYLDANGLGVFRPQDDEGCSVDESVFGNLTSGYVIRGRPVTPRQGRRAPWRVTHDYPTDRIVLLEKPLDDGVLRFERRA